MEKNMDMEFINTRMVISMMGNGLKTKKMALEYCITKVEPVTMVNGLMTKHAITESLLMSARMSTKVLIY